MPIYSFYNKTLLSHSLVFAKNKKQARKILHLVNYEDDLCQLDEISAINLLKRGYGAYKRVTGIDGVVYNEFFTFSDILKG